MIKTAKTETGQRAGMEARPSRIRSASAELEANLDEDDKELTRRLFLAMVQE